MRILDINISITESAPLCPGLSMLRAPGIDVRQDSHSSEASSLDHLPGSLPGLTSHVVTIDGFAVTEDGRSFSPCKSQIVNTITSIEDLLGLVDILVMLNMPALPCHKEAAQGTQGIRIGG